MRRSVIAMVVVLAAGPAAADDGYTGALATARRSAAAKDYPTAIAALQGALVIRPEDPTALSELSWVNFLAGDYPTAERAGVRGAVTAKQPTLQAMAWFNAGRAQEAQGELRSAFDSYRSSLALRGNADVQARFAHVTAALMTPRALLGPFETAAEFCTAAHLTAEQCHLTPTDDARTSIADADGGTPFVSVAMIVVDDSRAPYWPMMDLAIAVGDQWYVLPDIGTAASGHGGEHTIAPHLVGTRLLIDWHDEVGRFGRGRESSTIVCGLVGGAPRCAGPLLVESSFTDACDKFDEDCRPKTSVWVHCRASLRGDVLTVGRNPDKLENPDVGPLVGPARACSSLPWAGSHRLAF